MAFNLTHPYAINPLFKKKVAYFCMEFGIHQPLKIYAGGLGYLAGSYLRSAYELKQNIVGIGILWKRGYYDQVRKHDQRMEVLFEEKNYGFLEGTDIKFTIPIASHNVWVTAYYLRPEIFRTAPLLLLSTDLPENDYLAKSITDKLYDANPEAKIAAAILLGAGGAKLLEVLGWEPDVYHLNESHALPLAFYLYKKYNNVEKLRQRLVFTNHTPEEAGNQKTEIGILEKMGFFCGLPAATLGQLLSTRDNKLDHTLTALQLCKKANTVSAMHLHTMKKLLIKEDAFCPLIPITNGQNYTYWHDKEMYDALLQGDEAAFQARKTKCKLNLFEIVADQCGEIYDEKICTIVFAKRFAGYKRADLLLRDMDRFHKLATNKETPVQIIWAGKPYPMDYMAIGVFDKIVDICKQYTNCATLVGYELTLSRLLKQGADVWLNLPRLTHEASGTSGMSAAMNGAVNLAVPDGWFPEFAKHSINAFVLPACDKSLADHLQDDLDAASLYQMLENEVLPTYYNHPGRWMEIISNSMREVVPQFDSNRMTEEYYTKLYANEEEVGGTVFPADL